MTLTAERQFTMPKNLTEIVSTTIAILGFFGTIIALVYRYIRKAETNEREIGLLRVQFSEYKSEASSEIARMEGKVEVLGQTVSEINSRLSAMDAKIDLLLRLPKESERHGTSGGIV